MKRAPTRDRPRTRRRAPRAAQIVALIGGLLTGPLGEGALAAVASPETASRIRTLNDAARAAIKDGDYAAALTAYRQAIAALRDEPDAATERSMAMFLAAVCLEKLDRPAEAVAAHREALAAGLAEPLAGKARARIPGLEAAIAPGPAEAPIAPESAPAPAGAPMAATRSTAAVEAPPPAARAPEAMGTESDPEAALAAINTRAKAAVAASRWDDALAAYHEAVARLSSMPARRGELAMTWFLVGVCLDQLGRRGEAEPAYARARALGPDPAVLARIDERIGPPAAEIPGVPVTLACTPSDLAITVGELLDGASCDALRGLPAGTWRIEGRRADGPIGQRTVQITPGTGAHHISLVVPPRLDLPPPEADRRAAWVLTLGAAVTLGAGGALMALDDPDDLGPEARPVGIGLLALGGALGIGAIYAFATADSPRAVARPPGWGPVGWRF